MARTHTTASELRPTRDRSRIVGIDMARALALFGMMSTHLLPATLVGGSVTWWQQLSAGRAAALFALLAGVSLALLTARAAATPRPGDPTATHAPDAPSRSTAMRAARAGVLARAAVIGFLGLLLGGLDTGIAVILAYYAVLFVLGLPFLGLGWRALAGLAAGWALVAPVLSHLVRQHLPERLGASPSLDFVVLHPGRLLAELLFTGYYPAVPWLAYLLAGLAIGRLPLRRFATGAGIAVVGAALAALGWVTSWLLLHDFGGLGQLRATAPQGPPFDTLSLEQGLVRGLFGTTPTSSWWWLTTAAPHSSTTFDLVHTVGSAMLVLGVCLLASRLVPRVLGTLFAAGTMTLTLYSLHLVAIDLGPDGGAAVFWWHVLGATLFAIAGRAGPGRGPLEAFTGSVSEAARDSVLVVNRERR